VRFFFVFKTVQETVRIPKITQKNNNTERIKMKTRVMDNSRILENLKKLAVEAIAVLKQSRRARSCYEAGKLRRDLRDTLDKKEENSEKAFTDELVSALDDVADFLKDPERSFKSKKFKKLGDKISGFLEETGMKDTSK
jgi:hypothetical protein